MSISNKVWAIIGGAAALVIVPAGVSFAVVAAHDEFRPAIGERAPARAAQQGNYGMMHGGMFGNAGRTGARNQVQARDGSNCDGAGTVGTPPSSNARGYGPGMMNGSGPRTN